MIRTFFPAAAALLAWASPALAQQAHARSSSAEADDASAAVFELIEHRTAAAQSSSVAPADPPAMDDSLMVKRLARQPSGRGISIKSDNPDYPSWQDINPSRIDIVGRVLWFGRTLS